MKVIDCKQGSDDWFHERMGVVTASRFDMLMTPKTLKPSKSADRYLYQLLSEDLIGEPYGYDGNNPFMDRGTRLEGEAARWYAFKKGVDLSKVGFCVSDDGLVGASPDRLIGNDGMLEIKNPSAPVFTKYLIEGVGTEFTAQVQGQLLVTGRAYCDLLVFSPLSPHQIVIRHEPDLEWRAAFEPILAAFTARLVAGRARLEELAGELEGIE